MKKWILTFVVLLALSGCRVSKDPVTGEELYSVDPNTAAKVETGAEAAIGIGTVASTFYPVLLPIVTLLSGALVAWRKMKPKLTEAQSEAEMHHSATRAVVGVLEKFKDDNPDEWAKLEERFVKAIGPKTENIIRALRGLPPKE